MSTTTDSAAPPAPVPWNDPQRQQHFAHWLQTLQATHPLEPATLHLASADASFRRYLRLEGGGGTRIIMDAPPDKEDCRPFVQVAQLLHDAGIRAPEVLAWDAEHGFMLLSDLGTQTLLQTITPTAPPPLARYCEAVDLLVQWQRASRPGVLPPYDEALLRRELALFPDWYLGRHRGLTLSAAQTQVLEKTFSALVADNLSWPAVYVHRDFMPRNLMVGADGRLGVLDFQDAVYGPITYDIASLLRDAFLSWEEDFCLDITVRYWERARKAGLPVGDDFGAFYRGVEWMGLQRHLKVAGIFARLTLRDGKPQYLADTPRFIAYLRATCARYGALKPLLRLIDEAEGSSETSAYSFGRL